MPSAQYDAAYIELDDKNPPQTAEAVKQWLTAQGQDGWRLSWITQIGSKALIVVAERPVPPPAPAQGSLSGYKPTGP